MPGTSRFDCFPSDFLNGIVGLQADEVAAYTVLMMMQYDRGMPVQYTGREREIAIRAGMPIGRLRKAVAVLVDLGKLSLAAGCLTQARVSKELEKISERISKNVENSKKGGEATKKKILANANKTNGDDEPPGQPPGQPSGQPYPSSSVLRPSASIDKPTTTADPNAAREDQPPPISDIADLRVSVVRCFQTANSPVIPDTSVVEVWLSQGYEPAIILGVIRDILAKKRDVGGLAYFEPAIRRAHENRAPPVRLDDPNDPRIPLRGGSALLSRLREAYQSGNWPERYGPPIGQLGCHVPQKFVALITGRNSEAAA